MKNILYIFRRVPVPFVLATICQALYCNVCISNELQRYEFHETVMSISVRIVVCTESETMAQSAAETAFRRMHELNDIMTDFDANSELIKLCISGGKSGKPISVSDDLFRVLQKSKQISIASDGAFDVTIGPIVRLWRRARRLHAFPDQRLLDQAKSLVGNELWEIDEAAQTVTLKKDKMRFDLGGIAKGDIIDQAIETLKRVGIPAALVDAGGDVRVYGIPPQDDVIKSVGNKKNTGNVAESPPLTPDKTSDKAGWVIGISAHGEDVGRFVSDNIAMASSGDLSRFVTFDGVRYSHIVDPKTGLGLTNHTAVTVLATDAITADALASALSVLPPEKGLQLLEQFEGAAAMICRRVPPDMPTGQENHANPETTKIWFSDNWKNYVQDVQLISSNSDF